MLEKLLRHTGRVLADHQVAYLFKVPEEMSATPCDFFGYTKDGQAILIEAKEVKRTSLAIGSPPGMRPHQWNALRDAGRAGCIALICWVNDGVLATLDIDMAFSLSIGKDRRSIAWNDIPAKFKTFEPGKSDCLHLLHPYIRV